MRISSTAAVSSSGGPSGIPAVVFDGPNPFGSAAQSIRSNRIGFQSPFGSGVQGSTNLSSTTAVGTCQANFATLGGGLDTQIYSGADYSCIPGGASCAIGPGADSSVVGGGNSNVIFSPKGTIAGGELNSIGTSSDHATIGGGQQHSIGNSSDHATIGGGDFCIVSDNSDHGTIGGGLDNQVSAPKGWLGGGELNGVAPGAHHAMLLGGLNCAVSGAFGICGGHNNQCGPSSVALGEGTFALGTGVLAMAGGIGYTDQTYAFGLNAQAFDLFDLAWGQDATAQGGSTSAIGTNSTTNNSGDVAFGDSSNANQGVAFGASAAALLGTSVGISSSTNQGTAFGSGAQGTLRGVGFGHFAFGTNGGAALGDDTTASALRAAAIGADNEATAQAAVSTGNGVTNDEAGTRAHKSTDDGFAFHSDTDGVARTPGLAPNESADFAFGPAGGSDLVLKDGITYAMTVQISISCGGARARGIFFRLSARCDSGTVTFGGGVQEIIDTNGPAIGLVALSAPNPRELKFTLSTGVGITAALSADALVIFNRCQSI